jgi:ATP phosphoribosyltransferase
MQKNILTIGMPAGSLADTNRGGNLILLLENAGFRTTGYDSGGPTKFPFIQYFYGWDGRPQEFGSQLGIHELDVAIAGDDWIRERQLEMLYEYNTEISLEKVLSMKRGHVKIVGIANTQEETDISAFLKQLCQTKELITIVAEMPFIALNWIKTKLKEIGFSEKYNDSSVQKYKTPSKIKKGVLVYETWGKTESKVKNGGADIGIEITQTGSAIRNYGLKIIDTIMESETGIWINPSLKNNNDKKELLKMFLLNLYGCVNAENKVMILFNVRNDDVPAIEKYLRENNLFADEPTMNIGKQFTEFSIQVDKNNTNLPLARIRYELAVRKAVNIDTLPVNSSIPSMEIIGI